MKIIFLEIFFKFVSLLKSPLVSDTAVQNSVVINKQLDYVLHAIFIYLHKSTSNLDHPTCTSDKSDSKFLIEVLPTFQDI